MSAGCSCRFLRTEREQNHGGRRGGLPPSRTWAGAAPARIFRGWPHLRQNSSAVRSHALAPVPPAAAPAPACTGPATIESLGRQLRDVLPTRRVHSVSVCDAQANVLWLSEGALGPDEHSMVSEALEKLGADEALPCHEMGLEDGRLTLFLPVRAPDASLVGVAMVLADGKSLGDDTHERMAAQPVRAILMRLAVLMKPEEKAQSTLRAEEMSATAGTQDAREPSEPLSAQNVSDILEFDLSPEDTGHAHIRQPSAYPPTTSSHEGVLLQFTDEPTEPAITPQASAVAPASIAAAPAAVADQPPAGRTATAPATREPSGKAASESASKTADRKSVV